MALSLRSAIIILKVRNPINPIKVILLLIIFAYASIPSFSFAETKVYDKDWNLQKRIDDNGRIYDKDWNVTGKIQNDKIYDKDWNLKYRVRDDKIYDKDWNLKGRIDGDKIYDKAWNRKGTIRK